ncbi:MAG: MTH1187 family thiamine-binding protein [Candidatus Cryosericum sp.]|nr:MTH1187 family thiamine-binding protein [bacterium]
MSVLANFAIFPLDKGTSVSAYVARAVRIIRESGLPCQIGPMTTVIEGDWDEVMHVIDRCFKDLQNDSDRIYMTLNVDYREGRNNGITEKVASVERKL